MKRTAKRISLFLTALLIACATLPAFSVPALADPLPQETEAEIAEIPEGEILLEEPEEEEIGTISAMALPDEETLLTMYIEEMAPITQEALNDVVEEEPKLPKASARYWKLGDVEKKAYMKIRTLLQDISDGSENVARILLTFEDIYSEELLNTHFTAGMLGLSTLIYYDEEYDSVMFTDEACEAVQKKYEFQRRQVFHALSYDCPQYLFWFDKTTGMATSYMPEFDAAFNEETGEYELWLKRDSAYRFSFTVSSDYLGNGEGADAPYTTNSGRISSIDTALTKAAGIVSDAAGKTDEEMLAYYKDEICKAVVYDDAAAKGGVAYGDPWQIIYVFDDVDETNVVCEGYSKAFQFLCDQTTFADERTASHIVTGLMDGGTGAGGHMWNVVRLGTKNYLADITNCDEGSIGSPAKLFLKTEGDLEALTVTASSYTFLAGSTPISYEYDDTTLGMYDENELYLGVVEEPGDEPGDNPGGEPGDNPGGEPGDNPGGEPGDNPGGEPGDNPGGEPGDNPGDDPEPEIIPLAASEILSAANTVSGVKITWSAVGEATEYAVLRASGNGEFAEIASTDALSYTDTKAASGTTYRYAVKPYASQRTREGAESAARSIRFVAAPKIASAANTVSGVKITWSKVTGAARYAVLRKTGNGSYAVLGYTTALNYTDKTAKSGTTYAYAIRCCTAKNVMESSYYSSGRKIKYVAAPKIASAANTVNGVKITWKKITGAAKYAVLRKTGNGAYKAIAYTTALNYTDKTAKSGTTYTYAIRCCTAKKVMESSYYSSGRKIRYVAAPKVATIGNTKSGVKITWKKIGGAVKYAVLRKTGSGSYKVIGYTKGLNYTDKTAKSGTTYTYTVRCCNAKNAMESSYYSGGKRIRCKR